MMKKSEEKNNDEVLTLVRLPRDILVLIIAWLTLGDRLSLRLVAKLMKHLVDKDASYWETQIKKLTEEQTKELRPAHYQNVILFRHQLKNTLIKVLRENKISNFWGKPIKSFYTIPVYHEIQKTLQKEIDIEKLTLIILTDNAPAFISMCSRFEQMISFLVVTPANRNLILNGLSQLENATNVSFLIGDMNFLDVLFGALIKSRAVSCLTMALTLFWCLTDANQAVGLTKIINMLFRQFSDDYIRKLFFELTIMYASDESIKIVLNIVCKENPQAFRLFLWSCSEPMKTALVDRCMESKSKLLTDFAVSLGINTSKIREHLVKCEEDRKKFFTGTFQNYQMQINQDIAHFTTQPVTLDDTLNRMTTQHMTMTESIRNLQLEFTKADETARDDARLEGPKM